MQRQKLSVLAMTIALLISILPAPHSIFAQGGGTIGYGETVEGELADTSSHLWTFEGTAEDEIVISIVSEDFDYLLTVLDPNGLIIATDDSDPTSDDVLEMTLALDGSYSIVVATSDSEPSGTYTLTLSLADDTVDFEPEILLETNGNLPDGETALRTFTGEENDLITIFLISDSFDPVITLFDPTGERLVRDDDSGGQLNALIAIMLPADGDYSVEIGSYLADGGGPFNLIVTKGIPSADLNATVDGVFEDHSQVYTVATEAAANLRIAVNSEDFDTTALLLDASGELLGADDDSGGDSNALITANLDANRRYFIIVGAFEDESAGDYELVLTAELDATSDGGDGSIAYGDTITTTTAGVIPTYEFVGTAGDAISITLSSDDFDPILELYAPNGARLAVNDDIDAENFNAAIRFTLPTDGTYRILVSAFNPPPIGEFTLTLTTQSDAE